MAQTRSLTLNIKNSGQGAGYFATGSVSFVKADIDEIGDAVTYQLIPSSLKLASVYVTTTDCPPSQPIEGAKTIITSLGLLTGTSIGDTQSGDIQYKEVPTANCLWSSQNVFSTNFTNQAMYLTNVKHRYLWDIAGYSTDPKIYLIPRLIVISTNINTGLSVSTTSTLNIGFNFEE
jgi:hypothetical protein